MEKGELIFEIEDVFSIIGKGKRRLSRTSSRS